MKTTTKKRTAMSTKAPTVAKRQKFDLELALKEVARSNERFESYTLEQRQQFAAEARALTPFNRAYASVRRP